MKPLIGDWFDKHRLQSEAVAVYGWAGDFTCGAFRCRSPYNGRDLHIIASTGDGWDHLSVSTERHMPSWLEMEFVAKTFFAEDEVAYQLHVPAKDHINLHPFTLHWWRPQSLEIPLPPKLFV